LAKEAFLGARAQSAVAILSARLKAAVTWQALDQFAAGMLDEEALRQSATILSDKEIKLIAQTSVSEAYSMGRRDEAGRHKISRVYRQSVMDEGTCPVCAELHNKEWAYDDPDWYNYDPPEDGHCEGRDRCRCVMVFVAGEG